MKTVLVTGASKGIGRATAIAFAKEGYVVAINYNSSETDAQEVLNECNKHSEKNFIVQADISKEQGVRAMVEEVKSNFDTLDVLVNNAGIINDNDTFQNIEAFHDTYEKNLLAPAMVTKHVVDIMTKGKIVNVTSIHGRIGHGNQGVISYAAFKAAFDSYTKNLAKDLAPDILVNAVAPGRVATPMWGIENEEEKKELGKAHLVERMIEPEEIADAILFLTKNDAMCGEVLTIDGGMSLVTLG